MSAPTRVGAAGGGEAVVSVGVPTFNRAELLRRSLGSLRQQDVPGLEIVVSDNGSSDRTETVCKEASAADPRIRYVRQSVNRGAFRNFMETLRMARGMYFMWLGDDDWIGPGYLAECLGHLRANPGHSLVVGAAILHEGPGRSRPLPPVTLTDPDRSHRTVRFYETVDYNSVFYGLGPRSHFLKIRYQDRPGADWYAGAAMAFLGKVTTLDTCHIHRSGGGASASIRSVLEVHEVPLSMERHFFLHLTNHAFLDVWRNPVYAELQAFERWRLAVRVHQLLARRFSVSNCRAVASSLWSPIARLRMRIGLRTRMRRWLSNGSGGAAR